MSIIQRESDSTPGGGKPTAQIRARRCDHCGLKVPMAMLDRRSSEQFCCRGCHAAWHLIRDNGLDAFYGMVDPSDPVRPLDDRTSMEAVSKFADLDRTEFLGRFAKPLDDGRLQMTLHLEGIHCAACVWLIEKLPRMVTGVLAAQVNWAQRTVHITWRDGEVNPSRFAGVLHRLGYTPVPLHTNDRERARKRESRRFLIQIGIAGAAAGNNMLIAAALYLGMFHTMSGSIEQMLRVFSGLVGLVSFAGPGQVFLKGAWRALRRRTPHMDLPIALGLSVGMGAGVINLVRRNGEIYFDSISVLIFLLLLGRWIQLRQQGRAADAIELLYRLTPKYARRVSDGQSERVLVDDLVAGDVLEIWAGDLVPADALLIDGSTRVDESILSGESLPARKLTGDSLYAGTQNIDAVIRVRVTAVGQDTRLSQVVGLVELAAVERTPVVEWANRVAGYFVTAVVLLAGLTLLSGVWMEAANPVTRTVAVLIIACPCALGLATPLALSVALGRSSRRSIMIKDSDAILSLDQPGFIWLDKTGTLTTGRPELIGWHGDSRWMRHAIALESKSSHPVAKAFTCAGVESEPLVAGDIQIFSAGGMGGSVDGHRLLIGNRPLMQRFGIAIDRRWEQVEQRIVDANHSPCWIAIDHEIVALAEIGDRLRADARQSVAELEARGWKVGILSGDHPAIVENVAGQLGIELALGGLSPEEKASRVKQSTEDYRTVAMVGDGVNDCAALATATVGIAVHRGAEASMQAAPVYLAKPGLAPVIELLKICRSTNRTIKTGVSVSLMYNLTGVSLAMAGWINPLVAAVLMPISSLTVVAISLTAARRAGHDRVEPLAVPEIADSAESAKSLTVNHV